jgi:hypothetical protein
MGQEGGIGAARLMAGLVVLFAVGAFAPARAGPPFNTDDPVPVDKGHWEVYGFSGRIDTDGDRSGVLGGVEVNYGAAANLQLHLIVPASFDQPSGGKSRVGLGDLELGVKYRFFDPGEKSWAPQIAVFPLVEVATGKASSGLSGGTERIYLPIWLEKDFGPWTTYGGGGYWINPGTGNRNYWFVGWLLQRKITDKLAIGGEIFHQTRDEGDERDVTGFNAGFIYDFTEHYHLLFSAGRGVQNISANRFAYYVGLQRTF